MEVLGGFQFICLSGDHASSRFEDPPSPAWRRTKLGDLLSILAGFHLDLIVLHRSRVPLPGSKVLDKDRNCEECISAVSTRNPEGEPFLVPWVKAVSRIPAFLPGKHAPRKLHP